MTFPTPTVHSNGTSQEALLRQALDSMRAIDHAIESLCAGAPHGRDYYVQGIGAFEGADDAHRARIHALRDIKAELERIAMAVDEQRR